MKFLASLTLLFIKITFLPSVNLLSWLLIAIAVDFVTGFVKAMVKKEQRTSEAMRRTVVKFMQYLGAIAISIIIGNTAGENHISNVEAIMGYANDGLVIFIIYIELVSVLENLLEIDGKSMLSKYLFSPLHKLLTLSIKNNPAAKVIPIIGFIATLGMASCSNTKNVSSTIIKDSVITNTDTIYHDTTIILPGKIISVSIPCPGVKVNQQKDNGNMHLSAKDDGKGNVDIQCNTDSLNLVIDSLKEIVSKQQHFHSEVTRIPVPYEVIKYKVPKWCWYLLIANVLYVVWRCRKLIVALF